IQSAVFQPLANLVYVAVPEVEGAKPVDGHYVALPLDGKLDGFNPASGPELTPSRRPAPGAIRATALLRQASAIATEESRFVEAAGLLVEAAKLDPADPAYPLMAALTYFRAAPTRKGDTVKAAFVARGAELLDQAERLGLSAYQKALVALFRGRVADVLHRDHATARREYQLAATKLSRPLREAAEDGMGSRYKLGAFRKLVLDFIHVDVFRF
ncbi:MAG: hypothetical protein HY075_01285, partial [Deltaproteobacteria bacterium]|nr:hypothetical protein [Deltaproteobacteria bacterium]